MMILLKVVSHFLAWETIRVNYEILLGIAAWIIAKYAKTLRLNHQVLFSGLTVRVLHNANRKSHTSSQVSRLFPGMTNGLCLTMNPSAVNAFPVNTLIKNDG